MTNNNTNTNSNRRSNGDSSFRMKPGALRPTCISNSHCKAKLSRSLIMLPTNTNSIANGISSSNNKRFPSSSSTQYCSRTNPNYLHNNSKQCCNRTATFGRRHQFPTSPSWFLRPLHILLHRRLLLLQVTGSSSSSSIIIKNNLLLLRHHRLHHQPVLLVSSTTSILLLIKEGKPLLINSTFPFRPSPCTWHPLHPGDFLESVLLR